MVAPVSIETLFEGMSPRYPELRGQVAVVTGASRNIGLAIAARLGREGMRLAINGHVAEEVEESARGLRQLGCEVLALPADLTQPGAVDRLFSEVQQAYGAVHLLVNNAALLRRAAAAEISEALIDEALTLNLKVPLLAALRAREFMLGQGGGSIVNISSVGGLRSQHPGLPYGATKGGLDALTRNLAIDLAAENIRVNAVAPGLTRTRKPGGLSAADFAERARRVPLRRAGEISEIAAVVAFLASP